MAKMTLEINNEIELMLLEILLTRNAYLLTEEYRKIPTLLVKRDRDASNSLLDRIDILMHDAGLWGAEKLWDNVTEAESVAVAETESVAMPPPVSAPDTGIDNGR